MRWGAGLGFGAITFKFRAYLDWLYVGSEVPAVRYVYVRDHMNPKWGSSTLSY